MITHRPDGVRRVEVVRPGNRVIVAGERGRGGYAQRPLMVHNREFVQRTYYSITGGPMPASIVRLPSGEWF